MTAVERLNAILKANDVNSCRREEIVKAFALECAVLDACAAWPIARSAKRSDGSYTDYWGSVKGVYEAELARREVKR